MYEYQQARILDTALRDTCPHQSAIDTQSSRHHDRYTLARHPPRSSSHRREISKPQTALTVTFLLEAVRVLASGSRDRSAALREKPADALSANSVVDDGPVASGLEDVVRQVHAALVEEMMLSMELLRKEEEMAAADASAVAEVNHLVAENT